MHLRDYLLRNQLTTQSFADVSGVSQTRIAAICRGSGATAWTAYRIMKAAPEVSLLSLVGEGRGKQETGG